MTLIALVMCLLVAAMGVLGLFYPFKLLAFARQFESRAGLWAAGVFRVIFGIALFVSAPTSNAPQILRIVGIAIFLAGIATPLMGVNRARYFLNKLSDGGPVYIRILAGLALGIGLLLASAVVT